MIEFIFVVGGHFVPTWVDDPNVEHNAALMIEDKDQNYRVVLGLDRNDKLSRPYMPYYARTLSKDRLVYLRDELTKLIEMTNES